MTLRLEDSPVATAEAPARAVDGLAKKARPAADDLRCAKEVRILVVDDDEATGKVIEATLQGYGFNIRRVSDPTDVRTALEVAPAEAYHLILLDYVLPGLEAEQVFSWVRDF